MPIVLILTLSTALFGAFGAALGLVPVFWICALLLGGGASTHRGK